MLYFLHYQRYYAVYSTVLLLLFCFVPQNSTTKIMLNIAQEDYPDESHRRKIPNHYSQTAFEGDQVKLPCDPPQNAEVLMWITPLRENLLNKGLITLTEPEQRYSILYNGTLLIYYVDLDNAGVYSCVFWHTGLDDIPVLDTSQAEISMVIPLKSFSIMNPLGVVLGIAGAVVISGLFLYTLYHFCCKGQKHQTNPNRRSNGKQPTLEETPITAAIRDQQKTAEKENLTGQQKCKQTEQQINTVSTSYASLELSSSYAVIQSSTQESEIEITPKTIEAETVETFGTRSTTKPYQQALGYHYSSSKSYASMQATKDVRSMDNLSSSQYQKLGATLLNKIRASYSNPTIYLEPEDQGFKHYAISKQDVVC